jgi:hypothetical protein
MKDMALFLAICELAIIVVLMIIGGVLIHDRGYYKGKLELLQEQEAKAELPRIGAAR